MLSAAAEIQGRYSRFFVLLILSLCAVVLAGCKKDNEQSEAADLSAASVVTAPAEISAADIPAAMPSGEMRGLSIPVPTSDSQPVALPDMKPAQGMDMSVRMSQRMIQTPGWTQNFPALYKPVSDCLEQIDGGAAYVAAVKTESADTVLVTIADLDGSWKECHITNAGGQALSITAMQAQPYTGPLFYPRDAGKPVVTQPQCMIMESVVARPGGLIGWLGFQKPGCSLP